MNRIILDNLIPDWFFMNRLVDLIILFSLPEIQSFFLAGHRFMEDQSRDIFESDQAFIEVASMVLLAVGLISLTFVLLCKFFEWEFCDLNGPLIWRL